MAPHWKCGSRQRVEGSNPSLSAIRPLRDPEPGAGPAITGTLSHAVLGGELAVP
jgi:hypothetical protein